MGTGLYTKPLDSQIPTPVSEVFSAETGPVGLRAPEHQTDGEGGEGGSKTPE